MTGSMLSDQDLVKRVYFPRLAIPISALAATFGNTIFGLIILVGGLVYYGVVPPAAGRAGSGIPRARRGGRNGRRADGGGAERPVP